MPRCKKDQIDNLYTEATPTDKPEGTDVGETDFVNIDDESEEGAA